MAKDPIKIRDEIALDFAWKVVPSGGPDRLGQRAQANIDITEALDRYAEALGVERMRRSLKALDRFEGRVSAALSESRTPPPPRTDGMAEVRAQYDVGAKPKVDREATRAAAFLKILHQIKKIVEPVVGPNEGTVR